MSSKKNILVRCDSSSSIGLGHLMRTLLLAKGLKEYFNITFAVQELQGSQNVLISKNGFDLHILKSMDCQELLGLIQKLHPALCIVDHYGIGQECEASIKSQCPLLVFDDEFKEHNADIVLNHSFIAKPSDYDYLKDTKVLAGSTYTLLKDAFLEHKNRFVSLTTLKNKKVLITLGGTDVLGLSLLIKKALLNMEKTLHVNIVTTSANPQLEHLKRVEKNLIVDVENMAALMQEHDLVITSASTSLLETFALHKPFIAVQCAENQSKTVDVLKKNHLGNVIEHYNPASLKRALLFVQYRPNSLKRVLFKYTFCKNGAAKEIINAYS